MKITIVQGDITKQDGIDAIVNAARPSLLGGGGVDGAIHRAAGPQLVQACRLLPIVPDDLVNEATKYITVDPVRCPVGQAHITPAFDLPAKHVIHTVGPKYDSAEPEMMEELLASAYRESLQLAVQYGCRTVSFPAISCGVYAYPLFDAAEVAITVLKSQDWDLDEVRFVLFMDDVFEAFTEVLVEMEKA